MASIYMSLYPPILKYHGTVLYQVMKMLKLDYPAFISFFKRLELWKIILGIYDVS